MGHEELVRMGAESKITLQRFQMAVLLLETLFTRINSTTTTGCIDNSGVIQQYGDSSQKSIILEVDLIYPQILHDKHKDLPFCCDHKTCKNTRKKNTL